MEREKIERERGRSACLSSGLSWLPPQCPSSRARARTQAARRSPDEDTTAGAATPRWAVGRSAKAGGSRTEEEKDLLVAATRSTSQSGNKSEAVFWRGVAVVRPVPGCQPSRGASPADGAASERKAGGWRARGGKARRGWDGAAETGNVTITAARSANWSGKASDDRRGHGAAAGGPEAGCPPSLGTKPTDGAAT